MAVTLGRKIADTETGEVMRGTDKAVEVDLDGSGRPRSRERTCHIRDRTFGLAGTVARATERELFWVAIVIIEQGTQGLFRC